MCWYQLGAIIIEYLQTYKCDYSASSTSMKSQAQEMDYYVKAILKPFSRPGNQTPGCKIFVNL